MEALTPDTVPPPAAVSHISNVTFLLLLKASVMMKSPVFVPVLPLPAVVVRVLLRDVAVLSAVL